jgi:hypothetical protein
MHGNDKISDESLTGSQSEFSSVSSSSPSVYYVSRYGNFQNISEYEKLSEHLGPPTLKCRESLYYVLTLLCYKSRTVGQYPCHVELLFVDEGHVFG